MSGEIALRVEQLCKRDEKKRYLVDHVSFELQAGQVMGLVGVNGAGKTTTFKCVLGLIHCEYKRLEIFGKNIPTALKERWIGWVPEKPILVEGLRASEHLQLVSPEASKAETRTALEKVDLWERAGNKTVSQFSKGMRQRLVLAVALIRKPRLLVLDEPFSGLDFVGRDEMRALLLEFKKQGTTLLLSSHHTYDLTVLCDALVLLHKGKVILDKPMTTHSAEGLETELLESIRGTGQ